MILNPGWIFPRGPLELYRHFGCHSLNGRWSWHLVGRSQGCYQTHPAPTTKKFSLQNVSCSVANLWPTLCNPMDCSTPGFPVLISQSLLKLMPIESVMPSNHLILCHPILLPPSIWPSIRVFSDELVLYIRWPKYWSCSFNISPSNEHPGMISFRMDWLDVLAVQGTLSRVFSNTTVQKHQFFGTQLSL